MRTRHTGDSTADKLICWTKFPTEDIQQAGWAFSSSLARALGELAPWEKSPRGRAAPVCRSPARLGLSYTPVVPLRYMW